MHVNGQPCRTIWFDAAQDCVKVIDQTRLPHHFEIAALRTLDDACHAIVSMQIRGAPLIGVTAAFGVALALREGADELDAVCARLLNTRPTAVNLRWALDRVRSHLEPLAFAARAEAARAKKEAAAATAAALDGAAASRWRAVVDVTGVRWYENVRSSLPFVPSSAQRAHITHAPLTSPQFRRRKPVSPLGSYLRAVCLWRPRMGTLRRAPPPPPPPPPHRLGSGSL